jgi:large subunit ribosomal protein L35
MPKMKNHKGVKKRFKVSARGKVSHKKTYSGHIMSHKSGDRLRRLRKKNVVVEAIAKKLRRVLSA